ncbi:nuclear transport factor 2 family protein [Agaribacter flavus]|uniref:Nuclear transport factor 2 family protein n=1 Tax=Agaribacter flavus TaxID=1902781 RepID=A0ABV7FQ67_9ALTE
MANFQREKSLINNYLNKLEQAPSHAIESIFDEFVSDEFECFAVYPFNQMSSKKEAIDKVWMPLHKAFCRLQRRQDIFMAGRNEYDGKVWVMSMGHFLGLFDRDWLNIRATQKMTMLRYAEFFCIENDKILKSGLFFDIIGFMQMVGMNPLPPTTGNYFVYPGPRKHNGILTEVQSPEAGVKTLKLVEAMIDDLSTLNITANDNYPPAILAKTWHEDMEWYGPAGIGASYTITRYQQQHSYPFRQQLKDKKFNGHVCRIAEGEFACFFGWPNLTNTSTGGFLGLPGGSQPADMRVADIYSREDDKLKENWVLIDIPYWLKQQGLDIIERTTSILNPIKQ